MDATCPRCGSPAEIAAPELARCADGCGWTARVSTRLRRGGRRPVVRGRAGPLAQGGGVVLTVVAGAPFSGKCRWIAAEIERRESGGERGLLSLSYTALFAAMVPGDESVYRDGEVSDSGAPRFAGWLLAVATAEAATRELSGYVAVDSPRRAVDLLQRTGGDSLTEVQVPEATAVRRADEHVAMVSELSPRAGQDDAKARCLKMVRAYYSERDVLSTVDVRPVRAPDRPSDQAIRYAWTAAIRARRRGDNAASDKWANAARRMLATRGLPLGTPRKRS